MKPTRKQPLFIITGASGVGKSTLCEILFRKETDYIVMESDILWQGMFNTPEDDFEGYRKLWMRLCASISQIGKPVVLCGSAVPQQFETREERALFTEIHYLAVVCTQQALERRMRFGRGIADENWISSSRDFNAWLQANAEKTQPKITLLDTTERTPQQAADIADAWILARCGPFC